MYLGSTFAPLSLAGLLFKDSAVARSVPHSMVSAIVPVNDGEGTIRSCLKYIQEQSLRPFEVIVVDDCSNDMTPVILGKLSEKYSNLFILRNPENLGKAASVEKALSHVRAPYIVIVDSDTYLDRDYLKKTLGAFHNEEVVGASGMVLPSDIDTGVSKSRLIEYLHGQSTYKKLQNRAGVSFVCPGCCTVWRTAWIKENGIPTETVVEDMDLTWEAQVDGKRLAYVQEAIAYTEEPDTFKKYMKQINRWFSWRPVLEKHANRLSNGLKLLVLWMVAETIGLAIWMGLMLFSLISGKFFTAILLFSVDLIIVTTVSTYHGNKIKLPFSRILSSIPYYYLLRFPTLFIFWKSFIAPKRTGW